METPTMTPETGPTRNARSPSPTRRNSRAGGRGKSQDSGGTRYFLAKAGANGIPTLDREIASENEARIEALKVGGTYLTIDEWRPTVDLSKGAPVIGRETVEKNAKDSHHDRTAS